MWGAKMDEQKIKNMIFAQFITGGGLSAPSHLDNTEQAIWNRIVAQIEIGEMDQGGYSMSDYKQGAVDCLNGLIPKNGMSDEYYVGCSEQYAKEQQLSQGNN